jgi:hypothetical protein
MRRTHVLTLLILALPASACDGGRPGGVDTAADSVRHDFGQTAAFDRRLLFLGPGAELASAAVFDFGSLSDSVGVKRGVRARITEGGRWVPLVDEGWEMGVMRDPWRLVPHGSLKIVVNDRGELTSLIHRTDTTTVRLGLGVVLAEQSPDGGTQLVLRQATLEIDGDPTNGVVLDAQLGRAVAPAPAPSAPAAGPGDSATAEEPDTALSPTPAARPGAEAFVVDGGGYSLVLAPASGGDLAWVHSAGRSDVLRGARMEAVAWTETGEAATQVPTAWHIGSPQDRVTGQLDARATDHVSLRPLGLASLDYVLVTGWIEDRGVRRDVVGLVRQVR